MYTYLGLVITHLRGYWTVLQRCVLFLVSICENDVCNPERDGILYTRDCHDRVNMCSHTCTGMILQGGWGSIQIWFWLLWRIIKILARPSRMLSRHYCATMKIKDSSWFRKCVFLSMLKCSGWYWELHCTNRSKRQWDLTVKETSFDDMPAFSICVMSASSCGSIMKVQSLG